ncbi:MAG TPA: glucosyl transferase [Bacteroidota bacterium]|nr:glucosyl transferase [Bacteroidota bacterium]
MKFFTGNMMRSVSLLASSLLLLFLIPSCHKNEPCTTCPPSGPDTTSHSFNFTQFTFGGNAGSSYFNDVAIINDSLAYAVGAVYLTDSLGNPDPNAYNLAEWNGYNWQLLRIEFLTFCGQSGTTSAPAEAIWCFNDSDVWIASSNSQITTWNGKSQGAIMCLPVSVSKMWAVNKNALYTVGPLGQIGFYDGATWTKIESGTTLDIRGLWGVVDPMTGEPSLVAVASNGAMIPQGKKLLSVQGLTVSAVSDSGLAYSISGTWFLPGQYYVVGDGLFTTAALGQVWREDSTQPLLYKNAIRGNAANDIVVAGSYGLLSHYNGSSWKQYTGADIPSFNGEYTAVDMKGHMLVAAGWMDQKAVVLVGLRK